MHKNHTPSKLFKVWPKLPVVVWTQINSLCNTALLGLHGEHHVLVGGNLTPRPPLANRGRFNTGNPSALGCATKVGDKFDCSHGLELLGIPYYMSIGKPNDVYVRVA